jgi:hypothetical protein
VEEPPRLAGQSARDIRWALEQTLGAEVVARALARLAPEVRAEYEEPSPLSWVPYATVLAAHQAIADEAGTTMEEMLEAAVPLAVKRAFKTVWRILLRFTSDAVLIARAPLLYSKSRSRGEMTARLVEPGVARVELRGWPTIPPRDVRALELSIGTLLRLAGRDEVATSATRTDEGVAYRVTWRI